MSNLKIYDKVSWHYPEGKSPDLSSALNHFFVIMDWLNEHNLLTTEGKEIFDLGISPDFSITSAMVTLKGNELLNKYYSKWIKNIDGKTKNEMLDIWEKLIANSF